MKLILSLLILLTGCGSGMIILVNPKTNERITCQGRAAHPVLASIQTSDCAGQYEALGFVRAENLTPQQKEQVTKPTSQRIEQDITIRQEPMKP